MSSRILVLSLVVTDETQGIIIKISSIGPGNDWKPYSDVSVVIVDSADGYELEWFVNISDGPDGETRPGYWRSLWFFHSTTQIPLYVHNLSKRRICLYQVCCGEVVSIWRHLEFWCFFARFMTKLISFLGEVKAKKWHQHSLDGWSWLALDMHYPYCSLNWNYCTPLECHMLTLNICKRVLERGFRAPPPLGYTATIHYI